MDYELALQAVKINPRLIKHIPQEFLSSAPFVLDVVKNNLKFYSHDKNSKFMLDSLSDSIKDNKAVIEQLLEYTNLPLVIFRASDEIRNDISLFRTFVDKLSFIFVYGGEGITNNRDLVLRAISNYGFMLPRVKQEYYDEEMVEAALANYPYALTYVPDKMKTKKLIMKFVDKVRPSDIPQILLHDEEVFEKINCKHSLLTLPLKYFSPKYNLIARVTSEGERKLIPRRLHCNRNFSSKMATISYNRVPTEVQHIAPLVALLFHNRPELNYSINITHMNVAQFSQLYSHLTFKVKSPIKGFTRAEEEMFYDGSATNVVTILPTSNIRFYYNHTYIDNFIII